MPDFAREICDLINARKHPERTEWFDNGDGTTTVRLDGREAVVRVTPDGAEPA